MKPLVTIACGCGSLGDVPLGEHLSCACGAVYTADPATSAHLDAAHALGRRYRWHLVVSLLALLVVFAAPLVALDPAAVLFVPVAALATWFGTVRPHLDDRYRRALADLPAWVVAG